jgi:hypothetical protein
LPEEYDYRAGNYPVTVMIPKLVMAMVTPRLMAKVMNQASLRANWTKMVMRPKAVAADGDDDEYRRW